MRGKLNLLLCDHFHGLIFVSLSKIFWESLYFRKYVITEMKNALRTGSIDEEFFCPDSVSYLARMGKNFTFIDNLFLKFFAVLINRDIIVLPLHPESALINRIFGIFFLIII